MPKCDHHRPTKIRLSPLLLEIVSLVEAKGLSKRELSRRAGIDEAAFYRIKACRGFPRMDTVENMLAAVGYQLKVEPVERKHAV